MAGRYARWSAPHKYDFDMQLSARDMADEQWVKGEVAFQFVSTPTIRRLSKGPAFIFAAKSKSIHYRHFSIRTDLVGRSSDGLGQSQRFSRDHIGRSLPGIFLFRSWRALCGSGAALDAAIELLTVRLPVALTIKMVPRSEIRMLRA
jgi:hypothetical protein